MKDKVYENAKRVKRCSFQQVQGYSRQTSAQATILGALGESNALNIGRFTVSIDTIMLSNASVIRVQKNLEYCLLVGNSYSET